MFITYYVYNLIVALIWSVKEIRYVDLWPEHDPLSTGAIGPRSCCQKPKPKTETQSAAAGEYLCEPQVRRCAWAVRFLSAKENDNITTPKH